MVKLVESMAGAHPARAVVVVSNRPDAAGLARARALDIPAICVDHRAYDSRADFEIALRSALDEYRPDILCLAGFMRVLSAEFVGPWQGRMLNVHPSLLPKYKGLNTHQRAIDAGDQEGGVCVHLVTAELDDGPVLGTARVPIEAGDCADTLAARVLVEEHRLYPEVLARFVSNLA